MTLAMRDEEKRAEGRAEERTRQIESMLRRGKTAEDIVDFCGFDLEEVKKVEEQMMSVC